MRKKGTLTLMHSTDSQKSKPDHYLEQILANTPNYVYWKDQDSIYLGSNDSHAQLVGYKSGKDLVGKSDYDIAWHDQAYHIRLQDIEVMTSHTN